VANRIDLFDSTYSHFTKQVFETPGLCCRFSCSRCRWLRPHSISNDNNRCTGESDASSCKFHFGFLISVIALNATSTCGLSLMIQSARNRGVLALEKLEEEEGRIRKGMFDVRGLMFDVKP
jgi:hypothetical protein